MTIPTSLKSAARTALLGTLALGALGTVAAFAQEAAPAAAERRRSGRADHRQGRHRLDDDVLRSSCCS